MNPTVIILAAGMGQRLQMERPKALVRLAAGFNILSWQLSAIRGVFGNEIQPNVVVGYRAADFTSLDLNIRLLRNDRFDCTNTAKSLLLALKSGHFAPDSTGVLLLNGDVVLSPKVLKSLANRLGDDIPLAIVDRKSIGDEEVGYQLNDAGHISDIGKSLGDALGESIGIHFVPLRFVQRLIEILEACNDHAYFEEAIQALLSLGELTMDPITIKAGTALEVDFPEDLDEAKKLVETVLADARPPYLENC